MTDRYDSCSSHVLIDGRFDCGDAQDILLQLVNFKIEYHRRRCFSSNERFGRPDSASEQRIRVLEATRANLLEQLRGAMEAGEPLQLHCVVNLRPASAPAAAE